MLLWTYISGCPASVPGPCDKDIRQPADIDQGTGLHRLPQGGLAGCKAWGRGAGRGSSFAWNNRRERFVEASAVNRLSPARCRAPPTNRRHTVSMGEPGSFGTGKAAATEFEVGVWPCLYGGSGSRDDPGLGNESVDEHDQAGVAGFGHAAALPLAFPVVRTRMSRWLRAFCFRQTRPATDIRPWGRSGPGRTGPGDTRPRGELGWAKASAYADRSPGSSAGWAAAWARSWVAVSRSPDRACGRSAPLAALTASVGCLL